MSAWRGPPGGAPACCSSPQASGCWASSSASCGRSCSPRARHRAGHGALAAHRLAAPPPFAPALAAAVVVVGRHRGVVLIMALVVAGRGGQHAARSPRARHGRPDRPGLVSRAAAQPAAEPARRGVQQVTTRIQESVSTIAAGVLTGVGIDRVRRDHGVLALILAFLFVKDGPRFLPWVRTVAGAERGRAPRGGAPPGLGHGRVVHPPAGRRQPRRRGAHRRSACSSWACRWPCRWRC